MRSIRVRAQPEQKKVKEKKVYILIPFSYCM